MQRLFILKRNHGKFQVPLSLHTHRKEKGKYNSEVDWSYDFFFNGCKDEIGKNTSVYVNTLHSLVIELSLLYLNETENM